MWVKILLLFFVFSFLFKTDNSFDQDLGRHIKLGEIIWQTKQVPATNLFSYTNPDFPFVNTHWLFEIFVFLGQQTIELEALLVLKVIILLASVFLILKIVPKENRALLLPIGFIFLHVLRERTELRPEIFSFLFTAVTYYILNDFLVRAKSRTYLNAIYLLPIIQLLWINTHIYFFVGLVLQAIFLLHLGYQKLRFHPKGGNTKLMGIIFCLSVMASLINPAGLAGLLYPLNVTQNYGYTIVENQTMFLLESINFRDPNFLFVKISSLLIALSIIVVCLSSLRRQGSNYQNSAMDSRRSLPRATTRGGNDKGDGNCLKNILISLFGLTLALMNVRSFPYLVFLSLPAVLQNSGSIKSSFIKILVFIFGILLILESYLYLNGEYYKSRDDGNKPGLVVTESGKAALDFVLENNLPSTIYNNFDIGSYIIYRGYPKYQVFVDGRPEAYPKEFFQQVYVPAQSGYPRFKELESKYGFKTIIFSITDQTPWGKAFLVSVVKDSDWKTVYLDDFIIVLVKSDVLALQGRTLQALDLSKLDPNTYSFKSYLSYLRLSLFLLQTGNTQSAEKFAKVGLSLSPKSPLGNALFGTNISSKFFW